MMNPQDEGPDEADDPEAFDELDRMIDNVRTADDFLDFVDALVEEMWQDKEFRERTAVTFLTVLSRKQRLWRSIQTPELIRVPEQPDWQWLAEVFETAAFEN